MKALMMTDIRKLELVELPVPEIHRPDEVLVRVKAAGVCGSDLHGYTGQSGRRIPPLVMGHEAAGEVVAVGSAVTALGPRDRVAIQPIDRRGSKRILMGMDAPGAYAEYVVCPAGNLYPLPEQVSFEAGSLAEPLAVAVHAVGRAEVRDAASAVVIGAGPIGLLVASVLKRRNVPLVVVTDLSEARLEVARRLGIDAALNPARDDVIEAVRRLTDDRGADVAFEAVGLSATVAQAHAATQDGGTAVWIGNNLRTIELDMQEVVTRELNVLGSYGMTEDDFREALDLLAGGAVEADLIINRRASLGEGPELFDELLRSPEVLKCVFRLDQEWTE